MMYWYGGWGYIFMTISMLLFWAVVIIGLVALVRHFGRTGQQQIQQQTRPPARPAAEELLAERFARGEIDDEEYRRRLETLRAGGHTLSGT